MTDLAEKPLLRASKARPRLTRRVIPALGRAGVLLAIGATLVLWSILTPPMSTVDEPMHVNSILRLVQGGGWPPPQSAPVLEGTFVALQEAGRAPEGVAALDPLPIDEDRSRILHLSDDNLDGYTRTDWMTQHPPTYYGMVAIVLAPFAENMRWDEFVSMARVISITMVVGGVAFALAAVRRVTGSETAAIVGGLAVFAIPQFFNVLSLVTNDALAILAAGGAIYFAVRSLTSQGRPWVGNAVGAGAFLGLAMLTKGTLLTLVPVLGLALLIAGLRAGGPWWRRIGPFFVGMGMAAVLGGWWWARNLLVFGQLQSSNSGAPRNEVAFDGYSTSDFVGLVSYQLARTTWGSIRGTLALPAPLVLTLTFVFLGLLAVVLIFSRPLTRIIVGVLALFPVLTAGLILYNAWQVYWNSGRIVGVQGRYFFPALTLFVLVVGIAWLVVAAPAAKPLRLAVTSFFLVGPLAVQGFAISLTSRARWGDTGIDGMAAAGPYSTVFVVILVAVIVLTVASLCVSVLWRARTREEALPLRGGSAPAAALDGRAS